MKDNLVNVIIPIYNPPTLWEDSLVQHMGTLIRLFPHYSFSFIIVNDGTKNLSYERLQTLCKKLKIEYVSINSKINKGKGNALREGLKSNNAAYYICVDWDFPFGVIPIGEMLAVLRKGHDVVLVDRGKDYPAKLPVARGLVTNTWRFYLKHILHFNIPDTQGGLKGLNSKGKNAYIKTKISTYLCDVEFFYNSLEDNLSIEYIQTITRPGIHFVNFSLQAYFKELKSYLVLMREKRKIHNGNFAKQKKELVKGIVKPTG